MSSWCRECKSAQSLNWQNQNPEKYSQIKKDWYKKNLDFQQKQRNKSKSPKMKKKQSEWRYRNPDKVKQHSTYRNKHKKHEISISEWRSCKSYFQQCCAYCGLHASEHYRLRKGVKQKIDLHRDHVDHNGSNRIDNCIPACMNCNSSKYNKRLFDWFNVGNKNYSIERAEKILTWLYIDWKVNMT
ncbi:hypothetical protein DN757_02030 [Paenibacillus silvae]|uniref:HNH nuclease domain-containing protein n=2 Tax=Paenibacillus silvae TaxID=1325358 RepID=A0A2W6NNM7_9BACL|nr:hypothetical protein DN757_02030 [Paenibacillus silvae]